MPPAAWGRLADVPQELTGLTGWAASVMERLGEPGLALLVALENVFPPIPSEPVLALAGVLSTQGRLSLALVLLAATLGSLVGAVVLYEVGARYGRTRLVRLVDRLPMVAVSDLERAEAWFARHGQKAVFFGRFVPVVRSLVSIPAGIERMPRWRFLVLTALGSGAWNTAFVLLGLQAGERVDLDTISTILNVSLIVGAVVAAVVGVRRLLRARRSRAR